MSDAWIILDMNPDFDAVLARAVARMGPSVRDGLDAPCPRARASARLWVRRYAVGQPEPGGPAWLWWHHWPLIGAELERMGLAGAELCQDPRCQLCEAERQPEPITTFDVEYTAIREALACSI